MLPHSRVVGKPRFEGDTTHEPMTFIEACRQLADMIKPPPVVNDGRKMDGRRKMEAQVAGLSKLVNKKEMLLAEWAPGEYLAKVLGGSTTIFGIQSSDWSSCTEWAVGLVPPMGLDLGLGPGGMGLGLDATMGMGMDLGLDGMGEGQDATMGLGVDPPPLQL